MNLFNDRNMVIKLFEDKSIKPSYYPYNAKIEELEEKSESESESEFEESIAERTKMRRQKSDKENQEGEGFKMLTRDQIFRRLPISLAQLKAGNISEEFKNEIKQLLYSLHRSKKLSKTIYKHLVSTI